MQKRPRFAVGTRLKRVFCVVNISFRIHRTHIPTMVTPVVTGDPGSLRNGKLRRLLIIGDICGEFPGHITLS